MSNNNILGLPPINSDFDIGQNQDGLSAENKILPRSEVRETNQDSIRRRVAIDINAGNNEHAIQRVTQMDQKAFVAFFKSTQFIVEMNLEAQGTPYQKYCDAFSDRLIKESAHQTIKLLNVSAARIAYEVNRPPEREEHNGLWEMLFG